MRNVMMVTAYCGAGYHGWQIQPDVVTVQGTIRDFLIKITGEETSVIASGRTDTGVHALGQVMNFHTKSRLSADDLKKALNEILPLDISIVEARDVPDHFHSRYSVLSKHYRYAILNYGLPYGFQHSGVMLYSRNLDVGLMRSGARYLVGKHDFTPFSSNPGYRVENSTKILYSIDIIREGHYIYFDFVGSGFLYKMVRTIMGVLHLIGRGKEAPEIVKELLDEAERVQVAPIAPAEGLTLVRVNYPEGAFGPEKDR